MIYPAAGIAVSTGLAWGTSITDNSANWNTAFSWGDHAIAGYLDSGDIGSTVQAYDVDTAKLDVAQSWTATQTFKGLGETVAALSGTTPSISVANGTILTWTLTGNSSPTDGLSSGQSVTLEIDDGTAYTITWPSVTWKTDGGSPPTLKTTGINSIVLYKVGSVLNGARVGDA